MQDAGRPDPSRGSIAGRMAGSGEKRKVLLGGENWQIIFPKGIYGLLLAMAKIVIAK